MIALVAGIVKYILGEIANILERLGFSVFYLIEV